MRNKSVFDCALGEWIKGMVGCCGKWKEREKVIREIKTIKDEMETIEGLRNNERLSFTSNLKH